MYGVHAVVGRGHGVCPLVGSCLLVEVAIIGGSTVLHLVSSGTLDIIYEGENVCIAVFLFSQLRSKKFHLPNFYSLPPVYQP